jgi:hypothetical protein|tara:strand:- start:498 stop:884 length:387 start_codon:yes stop_codon:yes gene_type:complete
LSNSKFIVIIAISIAASGIFAAIFFLFPTGVSSGEYGIMVDPTKEKQSLFIMARVSIENTGSLPLTNVRVNFGEGEILSLGTLKPGQDIIVSPPAGNSLQYVIVTANEGIYVSKVYREPIAMPGMMGS